MAQFCALAEAVVAAARAEKEQEESMDDVPDEFLGAHAPPRPARARRWRCPLTARRVPLHADPLLFTLIKDPVRLPTSGIVMDRTVITQHLLNDQVRPPAARIALPALMQCVRDRRTPSIVRRCKWTCCSQVRACACMRVRARTALTAGVPPCCAQRRS